MIFKEPDYNNITIASFASSIACVLNVNAPKGAIPFVPEILDGLVASGINKADKVLIFHPQSIGENTIMNDAKSYSKLRSLSALRVHTLADYPPNPATCLATMYTGIECLKHGIKSEKKATQPNGETLIDTLTAKGKKIALIARKNSAEYALFGNKNIDLFLCDTDEEITQSSLNCIKEKKFDVVISCPKEFDDIIHMSKPTSAKAKNALSYHIATYELLKNAVDVYWKDYNCMLGFCPSNGCHKSFFFGNHGVMCPEDMNVLWFFGYKKAF